MHEVTQFRFTLAVLEKLRSYIYPAEWIMTAALFLFIHMTRILHPAKPASQSLLNTELAGIRHGTDSSPCCGPLRPSSSSFLPSPDAIIRLDSLTNVCPAAPQRTRWDAAVRRNLSAPALKLISHADSVLAFIPLPPTRPQVAHRMISPIFDATKLIETL